MSFKIPPVPNLNVSNASLANAVSGEFPQSADSLVQQQFNNTYGYTFMPTISSSNNFELGMPVPNSSSNVNITSFNSNGLTGGFQQTPAFMGQMIQDQINIAILNTLYKDNKLSENSIAVLTHGKSKPDLADADYFYGQGNPLLKPLEIFQWSDYAYVGGVGVSGAANIKMNANVNIITYNNQIGSVPNVNVSNYNGSCVQLFTIQANTPYAQELLQFIKQFVDRYVQVYNLTLNGWALAVAIMQNESSCNACSTNVNRGKYTTIDYGLMQINSGNIADDAYAQSIFNSAPPQYNVSKCSEKYYNIYANIKAGWHFMHTLYLPPLQQKFAIVAQTYPNYDNEEFCIMLLRLLYVHGQNILNSAYTANEILNIVNANLKQSEWIYAYETYEKLKNILV